MVHPSPTILSSSVGMSAPEPLLVRYIREHVRKGEAAKERAAQNQKKSEDHFIAAGQYLTMLKVTYDRQSLFDLRGERCARILIIENVGRNSALLRSNAASVSISHTPNG